MSLPRYPRYKDSGVEWLGQVPEHWQVKPLKSVATHNDDVLEETTAPDTEIAYVDISSVDGVNGINAKESMLFSAAPSRARRQVKHGDVIVSTVRTYLRAIARIREPEDNLVVSTGFAVVRPRAMLAPDFLGNVLFASYFVEQVIARSTGVSYPAINASELVAIPITVPPHDEQIAIASFLDRETLKIDALIVEQERLIELLKEKRQAVISHAVTKGLNPNVPMKDTGLEWIGSIPTHWRLKKLKPVTIRVHGIQMGPFGGMLKELKTEPTAFKLYGQENTINDDFACGSRWLSDEHFESLRDYELHPGDLVLTRKGASIGNCRVVPADIQRGVIDSDTIRVRLDSDVISIGFAVILMHEGYMESAILQRQKGSVLPGLNTDTIANLPIAIPPPEEQGSILSFLTEQTAKFDTLTTEAKRAIDLLGERRSALISAAVTGQIDVRRAHKS